MDAKDRQIVRALQQNGRMTNQDLAAQVNLSPSPCLRRVRLLEERGVIRGYAAQVDAEAYGLALTVFVRVTLSSHTEAVVKVFEQAMRRIPNVLDCHVMTGAADYLLRVVVEDLAGYEAFVRQSLHPIGGIGSIDSSFVYGTVKKTAVFPEV